MFRTPILASLGLALMSSVALAQPADTYRNDPANAPPSQLNNQDRDYPDRDYDDDQDDAAPQSRQQAQNNSARDIPCRREAAARTGYVSPGQAASREQTNGTVGGTVLGALAGAAIGSASGNAGAGAMIGGGAGMIAGTAVGANNARRAASDVEQDYAAAYYACMDGESTAPVRDARGYGPPPPRYRYDFYDPPPYYYGGYAPYYSPFYRPYYGPSISFGFGFGGGGHRGWGGGHHGGRHR